MGLTIDLLLTHSLEICYFWTSANFFFLDSLRYTLSRGHSNGKKYYNKGAYHKSVYCGPWFVVETLPVRQASDGKPCWVVTWEATPGSGRSGMLLLSWRLWVLWPLWGSVSVTKLAISASLLTVLSDSLEDSVADSLADSRADSLEDSLADSLSDPLEDSLACPTKSSKVGRTKERKYYILIVFISVKI